LPLLPSLRGELRRMEEGIAVLMKRKMIAGRTDR